MNKLAYCKSKYLKSLLMGSACGFVLMTGAYATNFDIPSGDLAAALDAYTTQTGIALIVSDNAVKGARTKGVRGGLSADEALARILAGTGFAMHHESGAVMIVRDYPKPSRANDSSPVHVAAASAPTVSGATLETVTVTSSKIGGDVQNIPISITALSQEQLTSRQIASGPDLVKEVPNLTFSKTNFTGYNIEIRGVGTQAISVTTDPAVAVAFNDTPFLRNHFFEQEFFDVNQVEILRGPQGTLYGRNATAGVVNVISAKPTDQYEATLSADLGNYGNRRLEGVLNIPIVGDKLDIRLAGEWTKRDGYTEDTTLNTPVDGRDLWSGRATLGWKPASNVQTYLIWEHFSEDDGRLRTGKQICKTAPIPATIDGISTAGLPAGFYSDAADFLSQGCEMTSLYSPSAFQVPEGFSLTYYAPLAAIDPATRGGFDVYGETTQSPNLRDIEAAVLPKYRAKNDTLEFNADWNVSPSLTFTSQTGFNQDYLWSTEDYNRFNSAQGAFVYGNEGNVITQPDPAAGQNGVPADSGIFCDPQLGCSDRLVLQDLSNEHAWQLSQEVRLASSFAGPFNFSVGANYLHYETVEDYYVFINSITSFVAANNKARAGNILPWMPGISNASQCMAGSYRYRDYSNPLLGVPGLPGWDDGCGYIDPNPISSVNGQGHNYFLSQNPYVLNSYAAFGEVYYKIADDLKLTTGLRFTDDQKHFNIIPSELLIPGYGYPQTGSTNQKWDRLTGRTVLDWTPKLDFTDQTLVYASYAHGYKAGGANSPGAFYGAINPGAQGAAGIVTSPIHPLTFKPEYIEAFELGTKNTLLDGSLTLNADVFYYNYSNYQISEIVDRTAITTNFNAHMEGGELEANWEPIPGLKFGLAQGVENTGLAGGDQAIDLMDRTAGNPNWMVVKPYTTVSSNCILPTYVVASAIFPPAEAGEPVPTLWCSGAYGSHIDPVTQAPYVPFPYGPGQYPGFDPATAPNNGEGFDKNLRGNQIPNTPHFTTALTAEYTMPVAENWAATLHGDFYRQSQQWARVFNDPIDKIQSYYTVNLSLILSSADGWQVMGYVKNVFDVTAITGTFLNSDDSGLTTNVFLTDPRLFGVRVTKHLDENDGFWGSDWSGKDLFTDVFADTDQKKPSLWIELGGQLTALNNPQKALALPFVPDYAHGATPLTSENPPHYGFDYSASISFQPDDSDWVYSAGVQFGRSKSFEHQHLQTANKAIPQNWFITKSLYPEQHVKFADTQATQGETHTIVDFLIGKDVGLGMFGTQGSSVVSAGIRVAQFVSKQNIDLLAEPDVQYPTAPINSIAEKYQFDHTKIRFHDYAQSQIGEASFTGLGPKIDWKASTPIAGKEEEGQLSLDWGANFALLFGRQKAQGHHQTTVKTYQVSQWQYINGGSNKVRTGRFFNVGQYDSLDQADPTAQHTNAVAHNRSRMVTVPNLGGYLGMSMKYNNAKLSFGYHADEFFGAIDGGVDARKTYTRGFNGPYVSVSLGLGG